MLRYPYGPIVVLLLVVFAGYSAERAETAPPLFQVAKGSALIDDQALAIGDTIAVGSVVYTQDAALRLTILGAQHGHIMLAPNSSIRGEELSDNGQWVLRLVIGRGTVQVDASNLDGSGFDGLVVRGGVVEAEMIGTLFVAQRIKRDADYVALVRGKLRVRDTIAALDRNQQRRSEIDLLPNQGITINAETGFAEPVFLSGPPLTKSLTAALADVVPDVEDSVVPPDDSGTAVSELDERLLRIRDSLGDGGLFSARDTDTPPLFKLLDGLEHTIGAGSSLDPLFIGTGLEGLLEKGLDSTSLDPVLADPPAPPPNPN